MMRIPSRTKRQRPLSDAAWSLLQRLHDERAVLAECEDSLCFRFHIASAGVCGDVVHSKTMSSLVVCGFLRESRSSGVCYKVSEKGAMALRRRMLEDAFSSPWFREEGVGTSQSFLEGAS